MKHLALIILSTALICSTTWASNPKTIQESISKEMSYPDFAKKDKIEGVVLVSFFVNNDGLISVELANSSNIDLKNYVVNKLKNMIVQNTEEETKFNMKFVFKLV